MLNLNELKQLRIIVVGPRFSGKFSLINKLTLNQNNKDTSYNHIQITKSVNESTNTEMTFFKSNYHANNFLTYNPFFFTDYTNVIFLITFMLIPPPDATKTHLEVISEINNYTEIQKYIRKIKQLVSNPKILLVGTNQNNETEEYLDIKNNFGIEYPFCFVNIKTNIGLDELKITLSNFSENFEKTQLEYETYTNVKKILTDRNETVIDINDISLMNIDNKYITALEKSLDIIHIKSTNFYIVNSKNFQNVLHELLDKKIIISELQNIKNITDKYNIDFTYFLMYLINNELAYIKNEKLNIFI